MLFAFLLYYFVILILMRVLHIAIRKYSLRGTKIYLVGFALGILAWIAVRWMLEEELAKEFQQRWYIGFVAIMLALVSYDWIQVWFDAED